MYVKYVNMSESKNELDPLLTHGSRRETRWKTCCFKIDPSCCRFGVCVFVSVILLLHCILELTKDGSCDTKSFYGPIISLIIGIWTPTPKNVKAR
jgi:hypothetical protein